MSCEKEVALEASALNLEIPSQVHTTINLKKAPKRILHFSDGTLEEYSSDEEESQDMIDAKSAELIDTSTLPWGRWITHQMYSSGTSALAVCDYLGEGVAYYLGITSPKYQYEIEEHERALKEEEEEKKELAEKMAGWNESTKQEVVSSFTSAPSDVTLGTSAGDTEMGTLAGGEEEKRYWCWLTIFVLSASFAGSWLVLKPQR